MDWPDFRIYCLKLLPANTEEEDHDKDLKEIISVQSFFKIVGGKKYTNVCNVVQAPVLGFVLISNWSIKWAEQAARIRLILTTNLHRRITKKIFL